MTVYVDNMLMRAKVPGARRANWSHLFADTPAELREFAQRLGLRAGWIQHAGTHREHFDVTASMRARALDLGAEPITYPSGVAELIMARRTVCQCKHLDECTWPREFVAGQRVARGDDLGVVATPAYAFGVELGVLFDGQEIPEVVDPAELQVRRCHYCGPTGRDLRPYGPGGAMVCRPCVDESPERTEAARLAYLGLLDANEAVSPTGLVAVGEESGPRPFDPAEARHA